MERSPEVGMIVDKLLRREPAGAGAHEKGGPKIQKMSTGRCRELPARGWGCFGEIFDSRSWSFDCGEKGIAVKREGDAGRPVSGTWV